jgi:hypothetical protein
MKLFLCCVVLTACAGSPDVGSTDAGAPPDDTGVPTSDAAVASEAGDSGTPVNPACANGYPKGPYGTAVGNVLDPTLTWQGYAANQTTVATLTLSDLFDCDGSKGIDALIFDTSAGWCAACETQAHDEAQLVSQYDQLGIKAITLLIMDASEQAATTQTALDWRTTYGLIDVGIYADPNFVLQPVNATTIGLPLTMIVDPRTMIVHQVLEGYGSSYPLQPNSMAVSIAQKNHTH